jgi:hypothetical protein
LEGDTNALLPSGRFIGKGSQWRTKGQNQNKNLREGNPTPSNSYFAGAREA